MVAEFFLLCAKLPLEQRKKQLEKGCTFIVKYSVEYGWDVLTRIERDTLPEEQWLMARVRFSREAYGEEQLHQGRAEGEAKGLAKGRDEGRDEAYSEVALRMLKEGDPDDKISRLTGMTKKELALLKRGLKAKKKR